MRRCWHATRAGTHPSFRPSSMRDTSGSWRWSENAARPRSGRGRMRGILADVNVRKQRRALLSIWTSDAWRDLWNGLGLVVENFRTLGLAHDASDAIIWRTCQREQLVLITGNRNKRGTDSLEATIQNENQPDRLPVITIANT